MSEQNLKRNIYLKLSLLFCGFVVLFTWQFMRFNIPFEQYAMSLVTAGCLFTGLSLGTRGSLIVALLVLFGYGTLKVGVVLWLGQPVDIGVSQLFWLIAVPVAAFLSGSLHETVSGVIDRLGTLHTEIEDLVAVDEATGLDNAKRFAFRVVEESSRTKRYGGEFSLMMVKIAFMDEMEDVHGARVQKMVILKVAEVIRSVKRVEDFVARIGRDEFGFVLPGTPKEGARTLQQRVKERLPYIDVTPAGEEFRRIKLTIKVGVSTYPEDGEEYIPLLNVARRDYEYDRG